jgi:hypothetical protein
MDTMMSVILVAAILKATDINGSVAIITVATSQNSTVAIMEISNVATVLIYNIL